MGGELWVSYLYKDREVKRVLSNYVPKEGDIVKIKTRRAKKFSTYKVFDVSHLIEEGNDWTDEIFRVVLE